VAEAAILSTCNRTELYLSAEEPQTAAEWLAQYHRCSPSELRPYLYTLPQDQAVRHAFRVAAGLDSMVLGEPQILGQMKEAVRLAQSAGTLGTVLHKLFQRASRWRRRCARTTQVGASSVSMAAAAVKLAARIFPSLKDQKVLFIGAGEMIELCATHFAAQAPRASRWPTAPLERAHALAHRFGGQGRSSCATSPSTCRSTTSSCPAPPVAADPRQGAGGARAARAPAPADVHGGPRGAARRRGRGGGARRRVPVHRRRPAGHRAGQPGRAPLQVEQAEAIIETQVGQFMHWMAARAAVPVIRSLRDQGEAARRHELERAQRMLARGDDPRLVLEALSQGLTNKLLHGPPGAQRGAEQERRALAALIERLYPPR
jgi:glutamyl-tRNA reductase